MHRRNWLVLAALGAASTGCNFDKVIESVVTVHTLDADGSPAADIPVAFQGPDGSVLAEAVTGADGTASEHIDPGGMVTVAFDYDGFKDLETWAGAVGGDHIYFLHDLGPIAVDVEVTLPQFPGAESYYAVAGCASASLETTDVPPPMTIEVNAECVTDPLEIALVAAGPAGFEQPLAFGFIDDAGDPGVGLLPVTLESWRTDFENVELSIANVPEGASYAGGRITPLRDGWRTIPRWRDVFADPAGSAAVTLRRAPGFGDSEVLQSWAYFDDDSEQTISRNDDGFSVTPSVDLAETLPRITSASIDHADPDRPSVSWSTGDVSDADLLYVVIGWTDGFWWLRGPPDTTVPFKTPALPASFSSWLPPGGGSSVFVSFQDDSEIAGPSEARTDNWIPGDAASGSWVFRESFAYGE